MKDSGAGLEQAPGEIKGDRAVEGSLESRVSVGGGERMEP